MANVATPKGEPFASQESDVDEAAAIKGEYFYSQGDAMDDG